MTPTATAVVAFGSNQGERGEIVATAANRLRALESTKSVSMSMTIETVAVKLTGPDPSAPAYLNAVAIVRTVATRDDFFRSLGRIENALGRVRLARWGDRTLDLDLIDFDHQRACTPELILPHPRAAERLFVLEPWLELDPEAELVGYGKVRRLIESLHNNR